MRNHIELPDFSNKTSSKKPVPASYPGQFRPLGGSQDAESELDLMADLTGFEADEMSGSGFDDLSINSDLDDMEPSLADEMSAIDGEILEEGALSPREMEDAFEAEMEETGVDPELYTAKTQDPPEEIDVAEISAHLTTKLAELEEKLGTFLLDQLLTPLKEVSKVELDERALQAMRSEVVKLVQLKSAVSVRLIGPPMLIEKFTALDLDEELSNIEMEVTQEPDKVDLVAVVDNQVFSTRIGEFSNFLTGLTHE